MNKKKTKYDYSYGLIPFYLEDSEPWYFVGQRSSPDGTVGYWKFPKGHKEDGENEVEAAIRETAEEIGVSVELDQVLTDQSFGEVYTYTRGADNRRGAGAVEKMNTYWLAQIEPDTEVYLNDEFSEYHWVKIDEALELLPENSRGFLEEAHDTLIKND